LGGEFFEEDAVVLVVGGADFLEAVALADAAAVLVDGLFGGKVEMAGEAVDFFEGDPDVTGAAGAAVAAGSAGKAEAGGVPKLGEGTVHGVGMVGENREVGKWGMNKRSAEYDYARSSRSMRASDVQATVRCRSERSEESTLDPGRSFATLRMTETYSVWCAIVRSGPYRVAVQRRRFLRKAWA
jgi:hypothetical protein